MESSVEVEKLHEKKPKEGFVPDPEKALDIVELLRLEAGRFLYEYPAPFRRTSDFK